MKRTAFALGFVLLFLVACGGHGGAPTPFVPSSARQPLVNEGKGGLNAFEIIALLLGASTTDVVDNGPNGEIWTADGVGGDFTLIDLKHPTKPMQFFPSFTNGTLTASGPDQIAFSRTDNLLYVTLQGGDGGLGTVDETGKGTLIPGLPANVYPAGGLVVCTNPFGTGYAVFFMGSDAVLYAYYSGGTEVEAVQNLSSSVSGGVLSMTSYKQSGDTILVLADNYDRKIDLYNANTKTLSAVPTTGAPNSVTPIGSTVWFTQSFAGFGVNAGYVQGGAAHNITDTNQGSADPDGIAVGPKGTNAVWINDGNGYLTSINTKTFATMDFLVPVTPAQLSFVNGLTTGSDGNEYAVGPWPGSGTSNPPAVAAYLNCLLKPVPASLTFTAIGQNQPFSATDAAVPCGTVSAQSTDAGVATVSGSAGSFTVHSVGTGHAFIKATDSLGNFTETPVTVK